MLQIANAFFKLPGDYLKPGEEEMMGMRAKLNEILAPNNEYGVAGESDWEIGDCLAQWWRPNFETFMVSEARRKGCTLYEMHKANPLNSYLTISHFLLPNVLTLTVPVCPSTYRKTERMQEALHDYLTGKDGTLGA
jgi:cleavage and polyadenylation specificity factor subunit 5